ncbi:MAG: hypothetical protein Q9187_008965, partial [Circinaria calcarea]
QRQRGSSSYTAKYFDPGRLYQVSSPNIPTFTYDDISKILLYCSSTNASVDVNALEYAKSGYTGATALNQSSFGTGQQQRANMSTVGARKSQRILSSSQNLYAEITFVCPLYWSAEAFTDNGREAYKYQYSVGGAQHGADITGYFGPPAPYQGPDFERAFMSTFITIWGNFIIHNNPSILSFIVNGPSSNDTITPNPASTWPRYSNTSPYQINLNETGGQSYSTVDVPLVGYTTEYRDPGLKK